MDENKKEYEISFLLASADAEKDVAEKLKNSGAEVFFQKPGASISLAYKIKRHQTALFGFYHFRASAEAVSKIESALRLSPGVIRFLIVTPPVKAIAGDQEKARVEKKSAAVPKILSNEALSEKLEEILK